MKESTEKFFFMLIVFGWEGPMTIWIGLRDNESAVIIFGVFFTYIFWGWFGLWADGVELLKGSSEK